jgi:hypothetical protein
MDKRATIVILKDKLPEAEARQGDILRMAYEIKTAM